MTLVGRQALERVTLDYGFGFHASSQREQWPGLVIAEMHATGATLLFNVARCALRPWPWILVALVSIVVFPTLESLREAFLHMPADVVKHDLAYPAMMTLLPSGLRGLVLASLIAAFMSTLSTHLNWGSSYVVNDFYKRFVRPEASEKELTRLTGLIARVLNEPKSYGVSSFFLPPPLRHRAALA